MCIRDSNRTISLPFANIIILKNKDFIKPKKKPLEDIKIIYSSFNQTVSDLQKIVNVKLVQRDATVIGLSMNYANIDKAKAIVNKLVEIYNLDAIKDKNSESMKTKNFIDERIGIIANELGEVEGQKEQFKVCLLYTSRCV